jgi:hypothetical protein
LTLQRQTLSILSAQLSNINGPAPEPSIIAGSVTALNFLLCSTTSEGMLWRIVIPEFNRGIDLSDETVALIYKCIKQVIQPLTDTKYYDVFKGN